MTWVPPTGGPGVGPTQPPADPPRAPEGAISSAAPVVPHAARTGLSTGWVIGIAVMGAIFAGSLIGGVGTGISNANHPYVPYTPYEPPTTDFEHGSPIAVDPLECPSACFDLDTARLATLGESEFSNSFLPDAVDLTDKLPITAQDAMDGAAQEWEDSGFVPDWCFPVFSELPVTETRGSDVGDGPVATLTEHTGSGDASRMVQTVRVFDDSLQASHYMYQLDDSLGQCLEYGDDGSTYVSVDYEDALHTPDSVAAVGFVRYEDDETVYVYDIQRSNVVIRSVYFTVGADNAFRSLMQQQADALSDLDPQAQ